MTEHTARARWTQKMKTDPLFRRQKLAHWQWQIDYAIGRGWPPPEHAVGGLEFYGRLHEQWQRERSSADPDGWAREDAEIEATVADNMRAYVARQSEVDAQQRKILGDLSERGPTAPMDPSVGTLDGRRPSEFVDEVKALMRAHQHAEAEQLLLRLLDATEQESQASGAGVAPWYYERLAVLYARRGDRASKVAVLERFARQRHTRGGVSAKLLERLHKASLRLRPDS